MDTGDIRFYRERWKDVEEFERQELRSTSVLERFRQINAIYRLAKGLGYSFETDKNELIIFERWARLKKDHR